MKYGFKMVVSLYKRSKGCEVDVFVLFQIIEKQVNLMARFHRKHLDRSCTIIEIY